MSTLQWLNKLIMLPGVTVEQAEHFPSDLLFKLISTLTPELRPLQGILQVSLAFDEDINVE